LGSIWLRDKSRIGLYCKEWIPHWGQAGKDLSILDITAPYLEKYMPEKYKAVGLEKVGALPDGKDFLMYTDRKNTIVTRSQFSDKVHGSAVRCISYMTANGLSFEHTDLFLGRCSEKRIVELWGPRLAKIPPVWMCLADRGFAGTARYYPNVNQQLTPKFKAGRRQFTVSEVKVDMDICKLRYTCEVAFSRVTTIKALRDRIGYWYFNDLDDMNHWGHARVNLMKPLIEVD